MVDKPWLGSCCLATFNLFPRQQNTRVLTDADIELFCLVFFIGMHSREEEWKGNLCHLPRPKIENKMTFWQFRTANKYNARDTMCIFLANSCKLLGQCETKSTLRFEPQKINRSTTALRIHVRINNSCFQTKATGSLNSVLCVMESN